MQIPIRLNQTRLSCHWDEERKVMKNRSILTLVLLVAMMGVGCRTSRTTPRPLIGITSVYKVNEDSSASVLLGFAYVRAVLESGGLPVILPAIESDRAICQYVDELDGLVLVGGRDIPPGAYGREPHETVDVMPAERYNFESKLISSWWASGKPILGVCLGMQFANVVRGGTLIQDIPSQVGKEVIHRGDDAYHLVEISPGSCLGKILGDDKAMVLSRHHQAVDDVGSGLKVVASSSDGVIEGLERIGGGFGLFVQWHPESMEDAAHRMAIYGALIRACVEVNKG